MIHLIHPFNTSDFTRRTQLAKYRLQRGPLWLAGAKSCFKNENLIKISCNLHSDGVCVRV